MKELKVALPKDCNLEKITTKVEDGNLIVVYEPKKEFKFGDYVINNEKGKCFGGIVLKVEDDNHIVVYNPVTSDKEFLHIDYCKNKYLIHADGKQIEYINSRMEEICCAIDYSKNDIVRKRWRAQYGYTFYYITYGGLIDSSIDYRRKNNDMLYNVGNYYQTEELALQALPFVLAAYKHNNK